MPNKYGHDRITFVVAGLLAGAMIYYQWEFWIAEALVSATIVGGCLFTPDLDLDARRWGPFACLWRPYVRLMPHRHFLSHGYLAIFSTAIRIIYFILFFFLIPAFVLWVSIKYKNSSSDFDMEGFRQMAIHALLSIYGLAPLNIWLAILGGLWIGSFSHTTADYIVSFAKRVWKRLSGRSSRRRSFRRRHGDHRAIAGD